MMAAGFEPSPAVTKSPASSDFGLTLEPLDHALPTHT